MECNIGRIDCIGRIAVELVLLVIGVAAPVEMTWRIVALAIAALALVTAIIRVCPVYAVLGISTCESEK